MKFFILSFLWVLIFSTSYAQVKLNTENGEALPVKGKIRVLVIFAEVDCSSCPELCHSESEIPLWPSGDIPPGANDFFDSALAPGQTPQKDATKYFYEASFGQYIVLGDYLDTIISVPCTSLSTGDGRPYIFNFIDNLPDPLTTASGYPLDSFDLWSNEGELGKFKNDTSNGIVDVTVIIWRNRDGVPYHCCACGYGLDDIFTVYSAKGLNFYYGASYTDCSGEIGFFSNEYFHGMFGGNEWHTGDGAGRHTFPFPTGSFSMTGQSRSSSERACGWDRWIMGWEGLKDNLTTQKDSLIAAIDLDGNEKFADLELSITSTEDTFILRDFYTTGDAIRIKLPHIDWVQPNDVKNQYLWLENHQGLSEFDHGGFPCEPQNKGLFVQVQVGKDSKHGENGPVYSGEMNRPNGLASFLFPLPADGRHDLEFLVDSASTKPGNCSNGKFVLPYDKSSQNILPNPFTGLSDLFLMYNWNGDSLMFKGDGILKEGIGLGELIDGKIEYNAARQGDSTDAFTLYGNNSLSISSNPAPVPVYTYTSGSPQPGVTGWEKWYNEDLFAPRSYENRTIWLNGLSIRIIDEQINQYIGGKDLKVVIRWDDYEVKNDVRWCGNIKLSKHDFDTTQSSLIVASNKTVHLDRGLSPERQRGTEKDAQGNWLFNEPTVFTLLPGSIATLNDGSKIIVDNKSTLKLQPNSTLNLNTGARIIVKNNSTLHINGGSLTSLANSKIIIEEGSKLIFENGSTLALNTSGAKLIIKGDLQIGNSANFTYSGSGHVVFDCSTCLPGWQKKNLLVGTGSKFTLSGSGTTDTILVVKQERLAVPSDLLDFNLSDGLVALGAGSKISTNSPVNMEYVLITSTNGIQNYHEGLWVNGQKNVSIDHCEFKNGDYGIYGHLFYNHGAGLTVINSTFTDNLIGVRTLSKGFDFTNLTFNNNDVGIWMEGITFPSYVTSSNIADGAWGINALGGIADLQLKDVSVSSADISGVKATDIPLYAFCSRFANNPKGIEALFATVLNLASGQLPPNAGKNYVGYNAAMSTGVWVDDAKILLLYNGENDFTDNKWTFEGGSNFFDTLSSIKANKNAWTNWSAPLDQDFFPFVVVENYDLQYKLWNGTPVRPIEIIDPGYIQSPAGLPVCGVPVPDPWDPEGVLVNCPNCPLLNNAPFASDSLHDAIVSAMGDMTRVNTLGQNTTAIDKFHAILTDNIHISPDTIEVILITLAYEAMKLAYADAYAEQEIYPVETGEGTSDANYRDKLLAVNDTLLNHATEYKDIMGFYFDKVNIYRGHENFSNAFR